MNFHSAFKKGQSQLSTNRVLRGNGVGTGRKISAVEEMDNKLKYVKQHAVSVELTYAQKTAKIAQRIM